MNETTIRRSYLTPKFDVRPAKKEVKKPGLFFEDRVENLAKKYKTIDEIWKHMTLGQVSRYSTIGPKIFLGTKLIYDESTGETFV